jgi:3-deoxy-8-phosphooctulonate synthase
MLGSAARDSRTFRARRTAPRAPVDGPGSTRGHAGRVTGIVNGMPSLDLRPDRLFLISGPCVIESADVCMRVGEHVKKACDKLGITFVFKASFDKANRTSAASFRGPGLQDGLVVLERVRRDLGVPCLTDIHEADQAPVAAKVVDVLQIPAFLARQTDLLVAAAHTGRAINVKKGQFMSPQEMNNAVSKIRDAGGGGDVLLTERGTFFGYNRLVNDFTGLAVMKQTGCRVVFDVTHRRRRGISPAGTRSTRRCSPARPWRAGAWTACSSSATPTRNPPGATRPPCSHWRRSNRCSDSAANFSTSAANGTSNMPVREDDEYEADERGGAVDDEDRDLPLESDMDPEGEDADLPVDDCPHCGKSVHEQAEWCHHCGQYLSREDAPARVPLWIILGAAAALGTMMFWMLSAR